MSLRFAGNTRKSRCGEEMRPTCVIFEDEVVFFSLLKSLSLCQVKLSRVECHQVNHHRLRVILATSRSHFFTAATLTCISLYGFDSGNVSELLVTAADIVPRQTNVTK